MKKQNNCFRKRFLVALAVSIIFYNYSCNSTDHDDHEKNTKISTSNSENKLDLIGKWNQTQGTGLSNLVINQYEFFDKNRFINTVISTDTINKVSFFNEGIYKIANDSIYFYLDKSPNTIYTVEKITEYSKSKIVLTGKDSKTVLEKEKTN